MRCILFLFSLFVTWKCQRNNSCPYDKILYSAESRKIEQTETNKLSSEIRWKLDSYLRKIGKGGLSGDIRSEFENITKNITQSTIRYDSIYVINYNALVSDICGKIQLLNEPNFSDEAKLDIEKQILKSVETFFERATVIPSARDTSKNQSKRKNIERPKQNIKKQIELSLQLDESSEGYKEIFLNGKRINPLTSSTTLNPRLIIYAQKDVNQDIIILTNSGDTCFLKNTFNPNFSIKRRLIPTCKH